MVTVTALSDLHGTLPTIEPCELMVIGGDLAPLEIARNSGAAKAWLTGPFAKWLEDAPAAETVAIAGNHDFVLEDAPGQGVHKGWGGLRWTYLQDAGLTTDSGLTVWGTPWAPQFGDWAFEADAGELAARFALIPEHVDILIVHGPPYGFGDRALPFGLPVAPSGRDRDNPGRHVGSRELTAAIERAQPRLAVYGHIHEDGGYRAQLDGSTLANVSIVDQGFKPVRAPARFQLEAGGSRALPVELAG